MLHLNFSEIIKSGYSLQNLKKEPQRLREAREENLSQTQNLAFENYKTFIQTADCSRDVFSEFGNVESKLDSLLDELPSGLYGSHVGRILKDSLRVERFPPYIFCA